MDTDGSGDISPDEFYEYMAKKARAAGNLITWCLIV